MTHLLSTESVIEEYTAIALSTAVLSDSDHDFFESTDDNMIMQRKTGFIVKLYEENEYNDRSDKLSSQLMTEVNKAFAENHRLIEIDMGIQEPETYKVLCVSLRDHLLQKDIDDLESLCESGETNMVMERDTGFFIKLYDTVEQNNSHFKHLSPELNHIILTALESGYRMIELDCDAQTYQCFKYVN